MRSEEIIVMISVECGISREKTSNQFLSKNELLLVFAHIQKQKMHIKSLKSEVEEHRRRESEVTAMTIVLRNEINSEEL